MTNERTDEEKLLSAPKDFNSRYAANLQPEWVHRLSVLSTFIIEIPLAFLFFAPTSALRKMSFFCQVLCYVILTKILFKT